MGKGIFLCVSIATDKVHHGESLHAYYSRGGSVSARDIAPLLRNRVRMREHTHYCTRTVAVGRD